ncbi:MAG TPA: alpha/beta fold hydrolase [Cerasibacillus sp.]|uniref:alpha/beta fold hydrolase n=1 Tax=Cerasibacillus sp. TaxID=2498711 RepID=UPI002F4148DA
MIYKETYIPFHQHHIYMKTIGRGEPILFLHGGPGDEHRYFLPHVEPLAAHFKLVFYDQAGCGRSMSPQNHRHSIAEEVELVRHIQTYLEVDKINILGQSWGSILALLYATTYPTAVHKLCLASALGLTGKSIVDFSEELMKRLVYKNARNCKILKRDNRFLFKTFNHCLIHIMSLIQRI